MIRFPVVTIAALAAGLIAPSAQAATVLDTSLNTDGSRVRSCTAPAPPGTVGVATRTFRAADTGFLTVETRGAGDWDVAVFDSAGGGFIAGSAQPGSRELAQGFVAKGQRLTLQACRFRGGSGALSVVARTVALQATQSDFKVQVVSVHTPTRADKDRLGTLGLDPAEGATARTVDVVLHDAGDAAKLRNAGFTWTVKIADLVALDRRNAARSRAQARSGTARAAALPSGRSDYRHLADYEAEMKALATKHPGLVKLISLRQKSLEGRTVLGIEIAKDVNVDDGKPVFLQLGVHHAREWPAGEAPLEYGYDLVNNYGKDARVTQIVDKSRTIIVPIVNPDGFNLSREAAGGQSVDPGVPAGEANSYIPPAVNEQLPVQDPVYIAALVADAATFSYKRRNCRVKDGAAPASGECGNPTNRNKGTDPNRNYGGLWGGPGASTSPTSDTYRGAGPFSEPETQNVRELVLANQVTTLVTNHTFTGLVLRPPGVRSQGAPPDEPALKALGDAMAAQVGYVSQPGYALYDTTGTTEDWSYGATGGYGFTYEIGKKQFHPPFSQFVAEYEGSGDYAGKGLRGAYLLASESTIDGAQHGVVRGTAPPGSVLRVTKTFKTLTSPVIDADGNVGPEQSFEDTINDTIQVGASGQFEWHLNPSTRPGVSRGRTLSDPADTPASKQDIGSQTPVPPGMPRDIVFDVTAGTRLIRGFVESEGPDYDLYLYEGSVAPENQVASAATEAASENLTYDYPKTGKYVLRIVNFAAVAPYTGAIELYQPKPGTEKVIPAQKESYTLTCETATGQVLTTNPLELDRGEVETMNPCGQNLGPGKVADVTSSGVKSSAGATFAFKMVVRGGRLRTVLRRGLTVRAQCTQSCRALAAATIPKRVAARFGIDGKATRRVIVARGAMTSVQPSVQDATFKLRFTKQARRKLRRAKLIRFAVIGQATSAEGDTARRAARLKVRR